MKRATTCRRLDGRITSRRRAFTLVELVVIVAILAFLAVFASSRTGSIAARARAVRAEAELATLRDALLAPNGGYVADMIGLPGFQPSEVRLANMLVATNLYVIAQRNADGTFPTAERADPPEGRASPERGLARGSEYTRRSEPGGRGWRGPYVAPPHGEFPRAADRRFRDDNTAAERGFFPNVASLYLAEDLRRAVNGCSAYGFPGEPAILDPWGNPYVLQVPPPQAFSRSPATVAPETRWQYARLVCAGPDGRLDTPCFFENRTNSTARAWIAREPRISRQAGRAGNGDTSLRGDDIVLFLNRSDIDEGADAWND